jgi:hypothetical protein
MEAFELESFAQYIKQNNMAGERHIPFYLDWVKRFLTADLPSIATSPKDRIQAFENLLSRNRSLQDWQIRQALNAVELYVNVFVKAASHKVQKTDAQKLAINEANQAYVQMRDLIRVRHYAYRTEQSYGSHPQHPRQTVNEIEPDRDAHQQDGEQPEQLNPEPCQSEYCLHVIHPANVHIEGFGDPSTGRRIPSAVWFALIFLFMSSKTRSSSACDAAKPAALPRSNPFVWADQRCWFVWQAGCNGYRGKTWMPG